MVSLFHRRILQKGMRMGIFRQQHNAEGIPVQSGHGMKSAFLPRPGKIPRYKIRQCAAVAAVGRMDQHTGGLIHSQQPIVLIKNGQRPILSRIFRFFVIQPDGDHISGLYGIICALRLPVDPDAVPPLELIHQTCGHPQFSQQKGRQPSFPFCNMLQLHVTTSAPVILSGA